MTDVTVVVHKDDVKEYPDCKVCKLKKCPDDCFDKHVGSLVALKKLCDTMGRVRMKVVG